MRPCMTSLAEDDDVAGNHQVRSDVADGVNLKGMQGIFLSIKFTSSPDSMLQRMPVLLSEGLDESLNTGKDLSGTTHDLRLAGEI